jgi:hypothetical protein
MRKLTESQWDERNQETSGIVRGDGSVVESQAVLRDSRRVSKVKRIAAIPTGRNMWRIRQDGKFH